jgi:hypothetical protein
MTLELSFPRKRESRVKRLDSPVSSTGQAYQVRNDNTVKSLLIHHTRKIKAQSSKLKVKTYQSVHNYVDTEEQIPLSLPLLAAQALAQRAKGRNSPLWERGVRGDFRNDMSGQLWTP